MEVPRIALKGLFISPLLKHLVPSGAPGHLHSLYPVDPFTVHLEHISLICPCEEIAIVEKDTWGSAYAGSSEWGKHPLLLLKSKLFQQHLGPQRKRWASRWCLEEMAWRRLQINVQVSDLHLWLLHCWLAIGTDNMGLFYYGQELLWVLPWHSSIPTTRGNSRLDHLYPSFPCTLRDPDRIPPYISSIWTCLVANDSNSKVFTGFLGICVLRLRSVSRHTVSLSISSYNSQWLLNTPKQKPVKIEYIPSNLCSPEFLFWTRCLKGRHAKLISLSSKSLPHTIFRQSNKFTDWLHEIT